MEQSDYLLRQAEKLGQVLGKILLKLSGLKENKTLCTESVNRLFTEELDFDLDKLTAIDDDKWIDVLRNDMQFDSDNLEKLADILFFTAENTSSCQQEQLFNKSLMIYQDIDKNENTYSFDRHFKIERIMAFLDIKFFL